MPLRASWADVESDPTYDKFVQRQVLQFLCWKQIQQMA